MRWVWTMLEGRQRPLGTMLNRQHRRPHHTVGPRRKIRRMKEISISRLIMLLVYCYCPFSTDRQYLLLYFKYVGECRAGSQLVIYKK